MKLKNRNGIALPAKMKFRSWLVLGPPGAGKSYLIDKVGGWPEEVCIDISMKRWWSSEPLTHRPREIHLAIPFKGHDGGFPVYDERWKGIETLPEVDFERISIPKKKTLILAPNWRARFVFDFILPPSTWLRQVRARRLASDDMRLVDLDLTPAWVAWQVYVYWCVACYFHQAGLQVMLRPFNTVRPYSFPVLSKVMKHKMKGYEQEITTALDWSKLESLKAWVGEISRLPEPGLGADAGEGPAPPETDSKVWRDPLEQNWGLPPAAAFALRAQEPVTRSNLLAYLWQHLATPGMTSTFRKHPFDR